MRLLLVEDERILSDQVAGRLRVEGYAVDIARDGQEALYMGGEFPIDAALVDLGLPKLPGIDVIRRWRAAGRTFPILILTARGRWQEKVEGLDTGADDYLVKPFQFEELLARFAGPDPPLQGVGYAVSGMRTGRIEHGESIRTG
ncbi:MAG: Virulence transcriptional regulatory protein PhoP [Chromatiales bacterium USCg_Taylor]|nr:MAG: Virulence transcriptional regulatory protein PhoP [Chromatiales bacterium USCg_Taylor]